MVPNRVRMLPRRVGSNYPTPKICIAEAKRFYKMSLAKLIPHELVYVTLIDGGIFQKIENTKRKQDWVHPDT